MAERGFGIGVSMVILLLHGSLAMQAVVAAEAVDEGTELSAGIDVTAAGTALDVGDVLDLTVHYRWPSDKELINKPSPGRDLQEWRLLSSKRKDRLQSGGLQREEWAVRVLLTRSGTLELPSFTMVLAADGPDGKPQRIESDAILVQVGVEVEEPALQDPMGLWERPPAAMEEQGRGLWWVPLVLLAGGAVLAVWLLQRRRSVTVRSPYEIACEELAAVPAQGDGKHIGAALSLAVRRYFGQRYGFDGVGATPLELLRHLRESVPVDQSSNLRQLFEQLDGLRWASGALPADRLAPFRESARQLVDADEVARMAAEAAQAEAKAATKAGAA